MDGGAVFFQHQRGKPPRPGASLPRHPQQDWVTGALLFGKSVYLPIFPNENETADPFLSGVGEVGCCSAMPGSTMG